jgi:DNA invertase Pin-like site-specific DNA recombinase
MAKKAAYARVSTKDQNLDRQIKMLLPYVDNNEDLIFKETASGKDIDHREKIKALMFFLDEGDTLYVTSLDRLGRNKADIKTILKHFADKKVIVRILDLPTTMTDASDEITAATLHMITDILVDVLGYVAEMERRYIRKRQGEGYAAAKAAGKKFGRMPKPFPETWESDYKQWKNKKVTAVSLMKSYGWAPATFYAKVREYEKSLKQG